MVYLLYLSSYFDPTWWVCFELLFAEVIAVVVVVVIIALAVEATNSALSSSTGPGTSDSKEAS